MSARAGPGVCGAKRRGSSGPGERGVSPGQPERRGGKTRGETRGPLTPPSSGTGAEAAGGADAQLDAGPGAEGARGRGRAGVPAGPAPPPGHRGRRGHPPARLLAPPPPPFLRDSRVSPGPGGGVSDRSPLPRPARPARPGPARQHSRLRQLGGSSPARPAAPAHSRPLRRHRIRVARGLDGRNTWGLCSRNRKLASPRPSRRRGLSRLWEVRASLRAGRSGRRGDRAERSGPRRAATEPPAGPFSACFVFLFLV